MKKRILQKDVAEAAGCTQQHLSLILNGKCRPGWELSKRLASSTDSSPILWLEGSPAEMKHHLHVLANGDGA